MTQKFIGETAPEHHYVMITVDRNSKLNQYPYWTIDGSLYDKLINEAVLGVIKMKNGVIDSIEQAPPENNNSRYIPRNKLKGEQKIWRYLESYKFEDLIINSSLYLSRLDQFIDNLEGVSPESCMSSILENNNLTSEKKEESISLYKERMELNRKSGFVCCWHINDSINRKMWDDYGKNSNDSIAIETSVKRLSEATKNSPLPVVFEKIRYYEDPFYNQEAHWFPVLFKHNKFAHEQEYRCGVFIRGAESNKAIRIKVNLRKLITRIYINPNATEEYVDNIKKLLKTNKINIPIVVSGL